MSSTFRVRKAPLCLAAAASLLPFISGPGHEASTLESGPEAMRLTILYDNTSTSDTFRADWGFACLVETADKAILFDTGAKVDILAQNVQALGIDLSRVSLVVLSHPHGDHTGGLPLVLDKLRGKDVPVYISESFPAEFVQKVEQAGLRPVRVKEFRSIGPGIYLSGEMGGPIKEMGLLLDTADGPLLVTGCAHPGIAHMIRESSRSLGREIFAVLGGFHLGNLDERAIKDLVDEFRTLGVKKCGPAHCTGEKAIRAFQKAYGPDFLAMGVGRRLTFRRSP